MSTLAIAYTKAPTVLSAERNTVAVVASNQTIDGDGDIIRAAGWDLNRVRAGQVKLLNAHNSRDITSIIGRMDSASIEGPELRAVVSYAVKESPLADFAWRMTLGGFLTGYSVGFVPRVIATLADLRGEDGTVKVKANRKLWDAAVDEMGLDPQATEKNCRRIICMGQLVELSALGVPSNPDAMIKAYRGGAIRDEDFASIGLGDDDSFALIEKGAKHWHAMNATQRKNLSDMLTGISAHHLQTRNDGTGAADQAQRSAAELEKDQQRAEFLATCKTLAAKLAAATQGDAGN